jgi:hypothetical protein
VGVSNTAGTNYYFNIMEYPVLNLKRIGDYLAKYISRKLTITIFMLIINVILTTILVYKEYSSPVEEMYHRQLVVTLDSILDARFGAGCCEEDIDTVNANTFHTKFSDMISPMD